MDKTRLIQIIRILEEIRGELDLNISDEQLFIQSCTYERGELANNKNSYSNPVTSNSSAFSGKEVNGNPVIKKAEQSTYKPSPKQFKILTEVGMKESIINKMSKEEVSRVIGEYLNNLGKRYDN